MMTCHSPAGFSAHWCTDMKGQHFNPSELLSLSRLDSNMVVLSPDEKQIWSPNDNINSNKDHTRFILQEGNVVKFHRHGWSTQMYLVILNV